MTSSARDIDPKDYTLVPKKQFDEILRGAEEMAKSIKFLLEEREKLLELNEKLTAAGDQLVKDAKQLMEKFKALRDDRDRLQKENERLGAALAQRLPKVKKGEGKN